jgi:hypothetical protein
MIEVTDRNGRTHLLNLDGIIRVEESGASSQWHGVRCHIKTTDGAIIECQQTIQELRSRMQALELSRLHAAPA